MSHKIVALDAKTGQPAGEVLVGRQVKVHTQLTPSPIKAETKPTEGQPPSPEGSVTEVTPIDPKFEALARKEAALRSKEREFQAEKASMDTRIQDAVNKALNEYKDRLKSSSLDELNTLGITYDQLVEQAVNAPNQETVEIKNELKALKDAQARQAEEAKNSSNAQREAAVKQIKYDAQDLIDSDPQFETIKATGSIDDVVELITRTFDETGRLMTVDQAAIKVEEELLEEAIKIANIGKVKAKLKPDLTQAVAQSKQQTTQQQQMTTLTNNMSSSRPLTARERAIKRFKGETF